MVRNESIREGEISTMSQDLPKLRHKYQNPQSEIYKVLCIAKHYETSEVFVVFKDGKSREFALPLSEWNKQFTLIDKELSND